MPKRSWRSKVAISPLLTEILLVAISVAVAIVTYSFVISQIMSTSETAKIRISIGNIEFKYVDMYLLNGSSIFRVRWPIGVTTTTTAILLTNPSYAYTKSLAMLTAEVETTSIFRNYTITVSSTAEVNTITLTSLPLTIHVRVRNIGSTVAVIHTIMVTGSDGTVYKGVLEQDNIIPPSKTVTFVFNDATGEFSWSPNSIYRVTVTTDTGFVAEASFASPAQ